MTPARPPFDVPSDLHARIGQLVLTGFEGLTARDADAAFGQIRSGTAGSVILFDSQELQGSPMRNIVSREQLRMLTAELHAAPAEVPVLICVDEEGAYMHRLRAEYGFPPMISHLEMGTGNDLVRTRREATVIAGAVRDAGIDMNLAPVVDLHDPSNLAVGFRARAFHSDPDIVIEHARTFIQAHHDLGVLTTLKHFPGQGRIAVNPATGREELIGWSEADLRPFRTLLAEGLPDAVLVSRGRCVEIDPDLPSTLSPRVVTGLLRDELGYDGVAISDAMELSSIWETFGFERALVLALRAGIDLLLFANIPFASVPPDQHRAGRAVEAIAAAVECGELSEERIDEACRRVLRLKSRLPAVAA